MKQLVGKNFNLVVFDKDRDVFVMFCEYLPEASLLFTHLLSLLPQNRPLRQVGWISPRCRSVAQAQRG